LKRRDVLWDKVEEGLREVQISRGEQVGVPVLIPERVVAVEVSDENNAFVSGCVFEEECNRWERGVDVARVVNVNDKDRTATGADSDRGYVGGGDWDLPRIIG